MNNLFTIGRAPIGTNLPSIWRVLSGFALPALILVSWEVLVREGIVNGIFFPPPSKLANLTAQLSADGTIWLHFSTTMGRLIPAFFIGTIMGVSVGLILGFSKTARSFTEPTLLSIYSIPKIALLPIFLAIFGAGEAALIALASISVFFYVWIYTMAAAMRTPKNLIVTARVFGASRAQILWQIVFRSALPEVMSGLRVGVTVGLLVCLTSEYVLGANGVGYLILGSRSLGQQGQSYVGILVASVLGLTLQMIVKQLDRAVNPWAQKITLASYSNKML